jgi:hypothetical protein
MKYRGLFHVHHHIIPFFDVNNYRLKKRIKKYLLFLKKNDIKIADFTWHSYLSCSNPGLSSKLISYWRLNLSPLEIFKLVKKGAAELGIILLSSLEVSCAIKTDSGEKIADILVMHEDEDILYSSNLAREHYFPFEKFWGEVPEGSLTVIAHPWRFGCGLAYHIGAEKTNEIIKKYNALVEYNGWVHPWNHLLDKLFSLLPFLELISVFKNFWLLAKKNIELSGLKDYIPFWGMDIHAPHLLPGGFGFVEFDIEEKLSAGKIMRALRDKKCIPAVPKKINFFKGMGWIARDSFAAFKDEIILEKIIKLKLCKKKNNNKKNKVLPRGFSRF